MTSRDVQRVRIRAAESSQTDASGATTKLYFEFEIEGRLAAPFKVLREIQATIYVKSLTDCDSRVILTHSLDIVGGGMDRDRKVLPFAECFCTFCFRQSTKFTRVFVCFYYEKGSKRQQMLHLR